jgi:hypothetical protein
MAVQMTARDGRILWIRDADKHRYGVKGDQDGGTEMHVTDRLAIARKVSNP